MLNNKKFIFVALFLVAFLMVGCNPQQSEEQADQQAPTTADTTTTRSGGEQGRDQFSGQLEDGWREVEIEAYQFGFEPEEIIVGQGDKIRLRARSTDVTHGLGIKAYNINRTLPPEEEQLIEFTAERAGEFHIHCTVYCGSGHGDMHAMIKVKE